jgi:hypothetical protein
MTEFWDSDREEWRQTERGTYVRIGNDEITGVVFERGGGWSGRSNVFDRFTRGRRDTPKAAAELVIEAEAEGEDSRLWSPPDTTAWEASKPKGGCPGFWRKRDGVILAVRQCRPGPNGYPPPSWFASIGAGDRVVAADGRQWFDTAAEAMLAADVENERRRASTPLQGG